MNVAEAAGLHTGETVVITKGVDTPWRRFKAYVDSIFVDHGFLRFIRPNRFTVAQGVERSSQPSPSDIKAAAKRGVKTIINLRAERNCGSFVLAEEACARHGIALVNLQVRSRDVPSPEVIACAKRLFDDVEYPLLMHCKSGCDRVGIMSALYLLLHEKRPVAEALDQLSFRYGHIRYAKTGVLDFFLETFARYHEKTPIDFYQWSQTVYDPKGTKRAFMEQWLAKKWFDWAFWRE